MRAFELYDSMSREVRRFQPLAPPKVGLFVCGLTPYEDAHIGHGRTFVVFDVVARSLQHWGYRVFYVQNVTNLDDKLIGRAAQEGVDPLALADRHFLAYRLSMEALGVRSVNYYPHATDYIPEIIAQVRTLVERGFAYESRGSVYFEVAKFPGYGRLSGQKLEELRSGTRIEAEPGKRAVEDFALWKAAKPGEPSWESPWGPGRPGWHIEDTAITVRLLGARYDIHGGGLDLKFPHHEAEIAQAESATGERPLVNYWMHAGMLNFSGEKMSKSLGNVVPLQAAIERHGAQVLRFYYLNAHYRSPLDYTEGKSLEEAKEAYQRLVQPYERISEALEQVGVNGAGRELPSEVGGQAAQLVEKLDTVLAQDFNTREAIALLFGWARTTSDWLPRLSALSGSGLLALSAPYRWGRELLGLFELRPGSGASGRLGRVVEAALAARTRARERGDYAESDRIRAALKAAGIAVEDEAGASRWHETAGGPS
jgi:cysteinyl-tRNA synthetase